MLALYKEERHFSDPQSKSKAHEWMALVSLVEASIEARLAKPNLPHGPEHAPNAISQTCNVHALIYV